MSKIKDTLLVNYRKPYQREALLALLEETTGSRMDWINKDKPVSVKFVVLDKAVLEEDEEASRDLLLRLITQEQGAYVYTCRLDMPERDEVRLVFVHNSSIRL